MPKATKKPTYKTVTPTRTQGAAKKKSTSKKPSHSTVTSTNSSVAGDTEPAESIMDVDDQPSLAELTSQAGTESADLGLDREDDDPQKQLSMSFSPVHCDPNKSLSEALQKAWRSPIYKFFKPKVLIQYHED
jgi:hypothetical protein